VHPLPVAVVQVGLDILLDEGERPLLLQHALDVLLDEEAAHLGLQQGEEFVDDLVSVFFEDTEDA